MEWNSHKKRPLVDISHFFWIITYFLKFAAPLELDLSLINSVLNFDLISYLTYEAVTQTEQLEHNSSPEGMEIIVRNLHLVITTIVELCQAIESFKSVPNMSAVNRQLLNRLLVQICSCEDLRNVFVLLLGRFDPTLHSKQYLQELIVANHMLLTLLDNVELEKGVKIKLIDHIKEFASLEIMHNYGMLLKEFNNNGKYTNDCIFTMMHYIAVDCSHIRTLFQPSILHTFSGILEANNELCDDWLIFMKYVIQKVITSANKSPSALNQKSITNSTKEHASEQQFCSWTEEELKKLYAYYTESKKAGDVVGKIVKLFQIHFEKQKSRVSIIQQLLQQNIITLLKYDDLMKFEDASFNCPDMGISDGLSLSKIPDDIDMLIDLIKKEKTDKYLIWLQKLLLECCYVKLVLQRSPHVVNSHTLKYIMEPMAYHCILKHRAIPIVQWSHGHSDIMQYEPFVLLLRKLGLQRPANTGTVYAQVPDFFSPIMMFNLAKRLGSLDKLLIKFNLNELQDSSTEVTSFIYNHVGITYMPRTSDMRVSGEDLRMNTCLKDAEQQQQLQHNANNPQVQDLLLQQLQLQGQQQRLQDEHLQQQHDLQPQHLLRMNDTNMLSNDKFRFSISKAKHANPKKGLMQKPEPMAAIPNRLQLAMHTKLTHFNEKQCFDIKHSSVSHVRINSTKAASSGAVRTTNAGYCGNSDALNVNFGDNCSSGGSGGIGLSMGGSSTGLGTMASGTLPENATNDDKDLYEQPSTSTAAAARKANRRYAVLSASTSVPSSQNSSSISKSSKEKSLSGSSSQRGVRKFSTDDDIHLKNIHGRYVERFDSGSNGIGSRQDSDFNAVNVAHSGYGDKN